MGRKRSMHVAAFRYRLDEIAENLKVRGGPRGAGRRRGPPGPTGRGPAGLGGWAAGRGVLAS